MLQEIIKNNIVINDKIAGLLTGKNNKSNNNNNDNNDINNNK